MYPTINTHNTINPSNVSFTFINDEDSVEIVVCIDDLSNPYVSYDNIRLEHDFVAKALSKCPCSFENSMENVFAIIVNENLIETLNHPIIATITDILTNYGWIKDDSIYE